MDIQRLKLMIPGPVQPSPEVMAAMGTPVVAHYGAEWTAFYNETLDMLRQVFRTRGDVFLLVGSGSSAIDASIGSLLATGEKIVVGINGFFGERLVSVARSYGLEVIAVEVPWGQPLRAEDFAAAIERNPAVKAIAVVHLETSTAIVNPIEEIGNIARRHEIPFIVDAVSSLGGLPFDMDGWGIDLCATASQKCLGAPPGLGPIAVSPRAWEVIDRQPNPTHGWYTNLRTWRQYATDWAAHHPFPITMATPNVLALRVALEQLLEEGIEQRLEKYRTLAVYLRERLRAVGYEPFTPDELLAPVLTAAWVPRGLTSHDVVNYMASEHCIKIAGGLGPELASRIIRIGHMSPTVSRQDIDEVVEGLEEMSRVRA